MKLDHYCFHESKSSEDQKKGLQGKFEEFLPPKLREDQKKKRFHRKLKSFCPRKPVKTKKKVQRSSSAQMQTIVKLLGGYIPPGFRHPCSVRYERHNFQDGQQTYQRCF